MSILSGNINLTNVNVRPDKITEIFEKANLPIALRAGLITKLNIKVNTILIIFSQMNLFNIFSDSVKLTVEDVLFIVGPNISHMSKEEVLLFNLIVQDFESNLNANYDENNPIKNLIQMHKRVKE